MKTIIHGDNLEKSREFYFKEKQNFKSPKFLNGESLTYDIFFLAAENNSLFDEEIELIIENLFAKNKSNSTELKKIVEYINNSKKLNLIIWEPILLTKTQTTLIKNAQINEFSIPRKMFVFLENLRPGNSHNLIKLFHEIVQSESVELVLFMLIRQLRLLIDLTVSKNKNIDEIKRMQPWQLSRLSSQAKYFKKEQLIVAYNKLFEIEVNSKTGKNPNSLASTIDFFLSYL